MTTLRRFVADDLFKFNNINLDPLTETYSISFYLQYLAQWPDYFTMAESASGARMGYIMGKAEGQGKLWHGHVTALTVAPEFRRMKLGEKLMNVLEEVSEKMYVKHIDASTHLVLTLHPYGFDRYNTYFVDLFVRCSNAVAIGMYKKFGYSVYRRVLQYYSGMKPSDTEDAFDMRKALPRDVKKESIIPLKHPVRPEDLEW
ncbi:N(alpha)-acetyltransferase 20, NatB catalytic subunit [Chytridiales sp. JEL 0842]|nr:N(alpha)-acetyltransferase 20, NatB catalytic subunit [Chytridiales sp. JEL 0842]